MYIGELKYIQVDCAYGTMLEILGHFEQFLDENDRCNPPNLLIPFSRVFGL